MRTVVTFKTQALIDVVKILNDTNRTKERQQAHFYIESLCRAHLPFLNVLINGYRAAATDAFAFEVSEWDVPIWFFSIDGDHEVIHLVPYATLNGFPAIRDGMGNDAKLIEANFAKPDEVQLAVNESRLPGELDLFDAWNLYYRGRFAECIRALVTSIEVMLEDRLEATLAGSRPLWENWWCVGKRVVLEIRDECGA